MNKIRNEAVIEHSPPVAMHSICPLEVALAVDIRDKEQALASAAKLVNRSLALDPEPIERALSRREQAGSTALGYGIAIPHARIDGIDHPLTVFLRARYPIAFDAPDGKPVSDFLVILVPAAGSPEEHLQMLAKVAQIFADREFREELAAADEPGDIRATFTAWLEGSTPPLPATIRHAA